MSIKALGHWKTLCAIMDMLVSTEWLSRHLGDPDLVVLDCTVLTEETPEGFRNRSGYEA